MMEILFAIAFWVACCIILGKYAETKGRDFGTWVIISLLVSPILGALILLIKGPAEGTVKQCPLCKEEIRADALKCKHCGTMLENIQENSPSEKSSFGLEAISEEDRLEKQLDSLKEGKCPSCDNLIDLNYTKCFACGTEFPSDDALKSGGL